jgi:hypothetical protein
MSAIPSFQTASYFFDECEEVLVSSEEGITYVCIDHGSDVPDDNMMKEMVFCDEDETITIKVRKEYTGYGTDNLDIKVTRISYKKDGDSEVLIAPEQYVFEFQDAPAWWKAKVDAEAEEY